MKKLFILFLAVCLCLPLFAACDSVETTTETKVTTEVTSEETSDATAEVTAEVTTDATTEVTTEKSSEETTPNISIETIEKITDETNEKADAETTEKITDPEGEIPTTPSEGLEFVSNGNGTCYVKSAGTFTGERLVIPSYAPNGDKVTKIGEKAFSKCDSIQALFIPNTVNSIEERAFEYCSSLRWITFEEASKLYSIGESAFINCVNLTQITLPKSLVTIEKEAFLTCYRLVEIDNYSNLEIEKSNLNGYVGYYSINVLNDGSRESGLIEKDGFLFCKNFSSNEYFLVSYLGGEGEVALPTDINGENYSIYNYAFYCRNDITKLTVNSGVTAINDYAFSTCKNLVEIDFSNSEKLTQIGMSAFAKCESLESLTFHKNLTLIYQLAFTECKNLKSVSFSENSNLYGIGAEAFKKCTSLEEITIPASTQAIGSYAFKECKALKSAIFENPEGWHLANSSQMIPSATLANPEKAADELKIRLSSGWKRDTI